MFDVPGGALVGENFQRQTSLQVQVTGTDTDDHADGSVGATVLPATNTDISGRIDNLTDLDFFRIVVPADTNSLVIRVNNLAGGIQPILKVYDSNGTNLLGKGNMTNAMAPGGYLMRQVQNGDGAIVFVSVSSPTAVGDYNIGAGAAVEGDIPAASPLDILKLQAV